MRAAVVREAGVVRLEEIDVPQPGPRQVLVRMAAAGVCHSDVTALNQLVPFPLPLVLGHEGIPVVQAARENVDLASSDLIGYMLNQRTGCMGPSGEDLEQEAEDFAALLIYRLGRLPSDRASIVQVRLGEAFG